MGDRLFVRIHKLREWIAVKAAPWLIPHFTCGRCGKDDFGVVDLYRPRCTDCLIVELGEKVLESERTARAALDGGQDG